MTLVAGDSHTCAVGEHTGRVIRVFHLEARGDDELAFGLKGGQEARTRAAFADVRFAESFLFSAPVHSVGDVRTNKTLADGGCRYLGLRHAHPAGLIAGLPDICVRLANVSNQHTHWNTAGLKGGDFFEL